MASPRSWSRITSKAGVNKACRYDPELNPSYQQLAEHYQVAVIPARPRKPRDKPKVEVGVQIVERWILARLRHQVFFSLAELNHCIRTLVTELNERPFKKRFCRISDMKLAKVALSVI
ncbi:Transposase and inactivated derivatives [Serratia fonticola]|nr:Transposase and inactivated derivatives [Serratia fonticola]